MRMFWPQEFFAHLQGLLIERFGLVVHSLCMMEEGQASKGLRYLGMFWPKYLFTQRQCPTVERFREWILFALNIQGCLTIESLGNMRMLWQQHLFTDSQRSFKQGFGLRIAIEFGL